MSETETEERREVVRTSPAVSTRSPASTVVVREGSVIPERVERVEVAPSPSPNVNRQEVETITRTNTGAIAGIIIGAAVLVIGMFLVLRETPFLPYPWSMFAILAVGLALIAVGASMVSNRSTSPP